MVRCDVDVTVSFEESNKKDWLMVAMEMHEI